MLSFSLSACGILSSCLLALALALATITISTSRRRNATLTWNPQHARRRYLLQTLAACYLAEHQKKV
jgi:hypothetical protein